MISENFFSKIPGLVTNNGMFSDYKSTMLNNGCFKVEKTPGEGGREEGKEEGRERVWKGKEGKKKKKRKRKKKKMPIKSQ